MLKSAQKRPKHGYLYLIQVRPGQPWLHKIGITQNPSARFEHLNDDNAGGNKLLRVIYVKGYEKKEAWIKNYFSSRSYFYHPFRGNGATEVFRFTWLDLAIISIAMEWWAIMDDWKIRFLWGLFKLAIPLYILHLLFPGIYEILIHQVCYILSAFLSTRFTA